MGLREFAQSFIPSASDRSSQDTENLFWQSWNRIQSADYTVDDCVTVFVHSSITTFYTEPENIERRALWARKFDEKASNLEDNQRIELVKKISNTLAPDRQVSMVCELSEFLHKPAWLKKVFGDLATYHRSQLSKPELYDSFRLAVALSPIPAQWQVDHMSLEAERRDTTHAPLWLNDLK